MKKYGFAGCFDTENDMIKNSKAMARIRDLIASKIGYPKYGFIDTNQRGYYYLIINI